MTVKEDKGELVKGILPVLGLGTAIIVVFAVLVRALALGQRVYQNGQHLVSVRFPGQWHDLRDFVQPSNPDILAVYSQLGPAPWALYDWVCRNIDYRRDIGEFWQTPGETLASNLGDCEDTSLLLCSLLQNAMNAHVALGSLEGYGHAWCQLNGEILETTYTSARPVPDPKDYCPYVYFNDQEVIELWPGALGEVFNLGRNEARKLNLIAEALEVCR